MTVSADDFMKSKMCRTIWTIEVLSENIFMINSPPGCLFTHHNVKPHPQILNFQLGYAN